MTESGSAAPIGARQRMLDALSNLAIGTASAALLGLVVVQGWQVFARYVLNNSPSWTEPVTLLLLSTAMALGAATGVREHRHFAFSLLADGLGERARAMAHALAALVIAAIGAVLTGWAAVLLVDGWPVKLAGAPLPQSINYLPLMVGGALITLFALDRLLQALRPARAEAR